MQKSICEVHHLGLMPYEPVWRLQEKLAAEIAGGTRKPTLLLLEHTHTYTFGRSGSPDHLIWNEEDISGRDVEIHWVDRGGDVTYHGPGQLVGYPLLSLGTIGLHQSPGSGSNRLPQADYIGYLRKLEAMLIGALATFGIRAKTIDGMTGVWVNKNSNVNLPSVPDHAQRMFKIGAIGVKVDAKGVTRHGFALNINPDMSYWQGIIACGLHGHEVTSLEEIMQPVPSMGKVSEAVITSFGQIFGYEMLPAENPIPG